MRKLFVTLALLGGLFVSGDSFAASVYACDDGQSYAPPLSGSPTQEQIDAQKALHCPKTVTVTGVDPGETSALVSGNVDILGGTTTVSVRLTCTRVHWRYVGGLVGDEAGAHYSQTGTDFSINVTGLTANTSYCAHVINYDSGKPTIVQTFAFTTDEVSAPPPTGDTITGGDDYFVGPGGSDANSGLSHANRWLTFPRNDTSRLAAGADLWLQSGAIYTEQMNIFRAWGSGGTNRSVTGCYVDDAGTEKECTPGVDPRPEINAGQPESFLENRTFDFENVYNCAGGDVMCSIYEGLINIHAFAHGSTVQGIKIARSPAQGIAASGAWGTPGSLTYVIIQDTEVWDVGQGPIFAGNHASLFIIRDNHFQRNGTCKQMKFTGQPDNTGPCDDVGVPGGIQIVRAPLCDCLVEGNVNIQHTGEGLNGFEQTTHVIYSENFTGDTLSNSAYIDGASDVVLESNIFLGISDGNLGWWTISTQSGHCTHNAIEFHVYHPLIRAFWRNNLVANCESALGFGLEHQSQLEGNQLWLYHYFNTYIHATKGTIKLFPGSLTDATISALRFESNYFWSVGATEGACNWGSTTSEEVFGTNVWAGDQPPLKCQGVGDYLNATADMPHPYATYGTYSWQNKPTGDDFKLRSTSHGATTGNIALVTTQMIDPTGFSYALASMRTTPNPDIWKMIGGYDYEWVARPTTGTIPAGAIVGFRS